MLFRVLRGNDVIVVPPWGLEPLNRGNNVDRIG